MTSTSHDLEAIQGWFGGAASEWDYTNEATDSRQLLTYTFDVTEDDRLRRLEIAA